MIRALLALVLLMSGAVAFADYDAQPRRPIDLSGYWKLNAALSDDPERMLAERLEAERQRYVRERRREQRARQPGAPADIQVERRLRPWQKRQLENFRRMLAVSDSLTIEQQGADVTITSAVESRRVTAGSHTQVSMPEGQLADSEVGWDGEWFVIERHVRRGPGALEKFRLLKNGQLEYYMRWSGDTELAGMKVRRIFDRSSAPLTTPNPELGPVR